MCVVQDDPASRPDVVRFDGAQEAQGVGAPARVDLDAGDVAKQLEDGRCTLLDRPAGTWR